MSYDFLNVLGNKEDYYKGEMDALKDNRTDINYDAGDYLRLGLAKILGRGDEFSKEATLKGAASARNEQLNKDSQRRQQIRAIKEADPLLGKTREPGDFKITSGMDVTEFDDSLARQSNLAARAIEAKVNNPKLNLNGVRTIGGITEAIGDRVREAEGEVGGIKYIEQQRLEDKKEAERRYYADRQDARRSENRRYEMQMMQLQQADKQKAQDRRDRMIMTLMAGLQNLGQGFTI